MLIQLRNLLLQLFLFATLSVQAETIQVTAQNFSYIPAYITINVGDTVVWTNNQGTHDVNGTTNSITGNPFNNPEDFDSETTNTIGSVIYTHVFTSAGEYNYDCSVGSHAANGMVGTINVQNVISFPINPCQIDVSLQDSLFNLWPDTIENLPIAQLDTYYETNLQIKTPEEVGEVTGYPYLVDVGLPFDVDISSFEIDSIQIIEVLGLPEGMSLFYSEANATFMVDAVGCVTLYGNTTTEMIGVHEITFVINVWVSVPAIGVIALEDVGDLEEITGYKFIVESAIIEGCTDPQACNYLENANIDNGNCIYPSSSMTNVVICEGDEFIWNNELYFQSGTYQYITSNFSGCDSIAILVLELNENSSSITNVAICEGDEFIWNNDLYFQSGTYQYTTSNFSGCDSIAILELEIFSIPESQVIIGENETTPFSTLTYALTNNSSNYQWNVSNGNILNNNGSSVEIIWGEDEIGSIEVIETNSNGCSTIHSLQVSLGNNTLNSWNCLNNACVDLMDGSGQYGSLNDCEVNCSVVFEDSWNCLNDACVDPMDGTGLYNSLNDCEANCSVVEDSWNCINDACVDPMDGTGVYNSLNDCEANCSSVIEDSWNCVNDACVDPMDGSGEFSTLNDCEQECSNISSLSETLIDLNIYPNPSSNIFNLEFYSDTKSKIVVTNVLGEQVYIESTKSVGEFSTQIDLSNYSKGIYNLTIKTSNSISNHKLILQ